jgi:ADP-ribosylglycohydrolase
MSKPPDHDARMQRARLSLEGLATGDAFGERFFVDPATVHGLIAARTLPKSPWAYTDDTVMAISIVEILEEHGHIDRDALAEAFARRYRQNPSRGYGGGAHRILGEIGRGSPWELEAGSAFGGQGSLGNGGAMRVAPLGAYFAGDLEQVAQEAARSAEVTHAHPEGQAGAVAVAVAAALAWEAGSEWSVEPGAFVGRVAEATPPGDTRDGLLKAASFPPDFSARSAASLVGNGSRITAPDTVPFCVWAAARFGGGTWEDALWHTVSVLGDRDTTCAMVGGILALPRGLEEIPLAWREAREALP